MLSVIAQTIAFILLYLVIEAAGYIVGLHDQAGLLIVVAFLAGPLALLRGKLKDLRCDADHLAQATDENTQRTAAVLTEIGETQTALNAALAGLTDAIAGDGEGDGEGETPVFGGPVTDER